MVYSLSTTSPFLKGLNTELNKLVDSSEYTADELNCMIRANNTRSRRPGVDYEELYKFNNEYLPTQKLDLAFNCIEWTDINSPDEAETYQGYPYIVCQVGGKIIFFRNEGQPYSGHQEEYVLDLQPYRLEANDNYMVERCKFTAAYGCIFITSKAIRPIYLRSAQASDDPVAPPSSAPACTLSVSLTNSKKGRGAGYGWFQLYINGVPVGVRRTIQDYNSGAVGNCSAGPWMMCSTQIAQYWNSLSASETMGITASPKYSDGWPQRWGIHSPLQGDDYPAYWGGVPKDYVTFTAPASSGTTLRGTVIQIKMECMEQSGSSTWTGTYDYKAIMTGGTSYVYKNNLVLGIRDTTAGANDFLAVDDNPLKMSYAHLYNLLNQGWTPTLIAKYYVNQTQPCFPGNNLAQQFLKDEKTEAFKPENSINMTFGNTPAARGHVKLNYFDQTRVSSSNLVNAFSQLVAAINTEGTTVTFHDIVDTSFDLEDDTQANLADALSQVPNVKPRKPYVVDICAYAGRIFYLSGDVLLYSQVIAEDITKADMCYTEADPTGEEISDVVETDGGLLSLPDIGEGIKMVQVGESLVVFGTRGNMLISGTANNIFTATAYSAGAVGAVPTQSPDSFVTTEYGVFYWGVTGINLLALTDQGLQVKDLTTDKILTFFGKISNAQHKACKGVYSSSKKKIYWFYPEDTNKPRSLNLCLVYDIQRDAFTPQKICTDSLKDGHSFIAPEIVSGVQLKVPYKADREYPLYAERITTQETNARTYTHAHITTGQHESIFYEAPTTITVNDKGYVKEDYIWSPVGVLDKTDSCSIQTRHVFERIDSRTTSFTLWGFGHDGGWRPGYHINKRSADNKWYAYADFLDSTKYPSKTLEIALTDGCAVWSHMEYNHTTNKTIMRFWLDPTGEAQNPPSNLSQWTQLSDGAWEGTPICEEFPKWTANQLWLVPSHTSTLTTGYGAYSTMWIDPNKFYIWHKPYPTTWVGRSVTSMGDSFYYNTDTDPLHWYYTSALDPAHPGGLLADKYRDRRNEYIDEYRTVTKPGSGISRQVCAKKWKSEDGYEEYIYMLLQDASSYPENTATSYADDKLFYDVDLTMPVQVNGRITAHSALFSADTVNDPATITYTINYLGEETGDTEIIDDSGYKVLADDPMDTEEFAYESSILLCLDPMSGKVTFGDFRNNYMRDWAEGDRIGDGYVFDSYMVSHPMNAKDFIRNKSMPYLLSYFKRTETGKTTEGEYLYGSKCQGSVRWDWSTNGDNSKWDSPNELYRPNKRTLLSEGYVTSKTNIRGIGRAYQVKLQGVEDHNFVVEALGFNLQQDERI